MAKGDGYEAATRRDAEAFAQTLKKAHLICRAYGHTPRPSNVNIVKLEGSRKKYYEQILTCRNRCGVKWRLLIDMATGIQLYRRADYSGAPGYLAKGVGRIGSDGKGAIRLEAITRHFTEGE